MPLKQVIEALELLENPHVNGCEVGKHIEERGLSTWDVVPLEGENGATDAITIHFAGTHGRKSGGNAPTLGIVGQLGGIGARPEVLGLVSDADGAVTAIACAFKLADLLTAGEQLAGDVIISTHICPNAPTIPHDPVPFMGSPVGLDAMHRVMIQKEMEAILSIDTTRGNRVVNRRGFAITPTVKEGYILKVSDKLLTIMSVVSGRAPVVLPLSTQDITPYGNGIDHINSIMQPATATDAPVVGVALTAESVVPGCASGANQPLDIEMTARFCLETAKAFGKDKDLFFDRDEFDQLLGLYGSMRHLQTTGKQKPQADGKG